MAKKSQQVRRQIADWSDARQFAQWVAYALKPGGYEDYTPTWTDGSTALDAGTGGSVAGRYRLNAFFCYVQIHLVVGTSASLGTGDWEFGLPLAHVAGGVAGLGSALVYDASAGTFYLGVARVAPGAQVAKAVVERLATAAQYLDHNSGHPIAFGAGDEVTIALEYPL